MHREACDEQAVPSLGKERAYYRERRPRQTAAIRSCGCESHAGVSVTRGLDLIGQPAQRPGKSLWTRGVHSEIEQQC
jgi:hypothetical protein